MKKTLTTLIILLIVSCNSISKEQLTLSRNLSLVKSKYTEAKVEQYRHFSYIFRVIENDTTLVEVFKDGKNTIEFKILK